MFKGMIPKNVRPRVSMLTQLSSHEIIWIPQWNFLKVYRGGFFRAQKINPTPFSKGVSRGCTLDSSPLRRLPPVSSSLFGRKGDTEFPLWDIVEVPKYLQVNKILIRNVLFHNNYAQHFVKLVDFKEHLVQV